MTAVGMKAERKNDRDACRFPCRWDAKHPLGTAGIFFGMWIVSIFFLTACSAPLMGAFSGRPALTRLFLESLSLASVAIPTVACSRLLGSARRRRPLGKTALWTACGLLAGSLWFAVSFGILTVLVDVEAAPSANEAWLPLWIASCAINAAFQELLVRGYAFDMLAKGKGVVFATAATTVAFVLFHPGAFADGPVAVMQMAAASVLLAAFRLLSGGLAAPIAMHAAWNSLGGVVFGVVILAEDYPAVFETTLEGPAPLIGGSMGLEGSAVTLAVTCAVCLFAAALYRRAGRG